MISFLFKKLFKNKQIRQVASIRFQNEHFIVILKDFSYWEKASSMNITVQWYTGRDEIIDLCAEKWNVDRAKKS